MYPRHRIDITFTDLAFGLGACAMAWRRDRIAERIERLIAPPDDAIVCLSVRSAFDLVLDVLELPPRSEVLVSAITHPDMIGILELHGLCPVPVDLDLGTLEPRTDVLQSAVTGRTRMILVAHLFGATVDLGASADVAGQHGLLLVEDCAQSLTEGRVRGDPLADISMFSFGPIKTATALGGAIVRVRSPELRDRMRETLAGRPIQPRGEFMRRTAKFSLLGLLGQPAAFGLFVRVCKIVGRDLDELLGAFVRGFKASYDDPEFASRIRRQPSAPLMTLLLRRLRRFEESKLRRRAWIGEKLARSLPAAATCPGQKGARRTHWVFPILVSDAPALIEALRAGGFDAAPATATSAIGVVPAPPGHPELAPVDSEWLLPQLAFLPCYPQLPDRAVGQLIEAVQAALTGAAPIIPEPLERFRAGVD